MSTSVLPQLLEVDSELSAQASTLEAQLNELQEKRKGIQTVIAMFESGATPDVAEIAAATASASSGKTTKRAAKATKTKAKTKAAKATKATKTKVAKATKATKTKATKVKATRGRPAKAKPASAAKKAGTKRSGRTANWQRYVQDNYSKAPLPDVIVGVLQAQPSNVFKIADVMSAVFKEDMPKNHFLKARNRVSNILSAGARDGHWYRGRGGTYSASEKAIKAAG
ncbi:MAG: hypothetical protein AAFO06_00130 [Cyanobacteria bacterium J06597_16]